MTTVALAWIIFGVSLVVLSFALLAGAKIYRKVPPHLFDKPFSKGSKRVGVVELGEQDISEGVKTLMENIGSHPVTKCLERHRSGDWGEMDDENRHLNNL